MPSRWIVAVGFAALMAVGGACSREPSAPAGAPEFSVVASQGWERGTLRLTAPDLATIASLTVVFDDTLILDTLRVHRAGPDTLLVRVSVAPGFHTVRISSSGARSAAQGFEVDGLDQTSSAISVSLVSRPLWLGNGSSQFWVGTAQGLARLDARTPSLAPVLVDSTVDPSCLASIGASANGAVVAADRGCGTLRARVYTPGSAFVEVDSGPPASGWHNALNRPPGVWLLLKSDTVALAVRAAGGSWTWTRWGYAHGSQSDLGLSPDGRLAVAELGMFSAHPQIMVFDLEHGVLLYQDASVGPMVAFSPSSDTLVAVGGDTTVVLLASRTGTRLTTVYTRAGQGSWYPLAWDPFGPWLLGFQGGCCLGFGVIDRRTWTYAGAAGGGDAYFDGVLGFSGAERVGWIIYSNDLIHLGPAWIVSFMIPGP